MFRQIFSRFSAQIKVTIKKLKLSQDRFEGKYNEKTNPIYFYHPQSFARFMQPHRFSARGSRKRPTQRTRCCHPYYNGDRHTHPGDSCLAGRRSHAQRRLRSGDDGIQPGAQFTRYRDRRPGKSGHWPHLLLQRKLQPGPAKTGVAGQHLYFQQVTHQRLFLSGKNLRSA
ncbi:hypothetical protein SDC9_119582 [bioreactor metagenome]|uniref:Uncharacterized protein n=1 Tax=bioreactor metagenome TaxID=1076179 RepID=A0A645C482_9ZZZZ